MSATIDGRPQAIQPGERLIDLINRCGVELPQVCYHPQLGPIQSCDTCMVEVDGKLLRAGGAVAADGMNVVVSSSRADAARREAFDRILGNHMLYCTVCDNNNGNCTVHNTTRLLQVEHQQIPYKPKPYEVDMSNPFYRYDPDQCILCGRCVQACQTLEVNETLSINWEDPHPRVLWDGGAPIGESSCVSCGHCVTVCPCNALMEKHMLGEAGYFTSLSKPALDGMIDIVKGIEPEIGYGSILQLSEMESHMRDSRIRRTKTVCTYCGVGCSFDVWTKERQILKVEPAHGAANGVSTCIKGKFGWDYVNSPDRLTKPLIREGDIFREVSWDEALTLVARRFAEIKAATGPDSLAFISSSKCTNEESYLMQKLARAVIGTNNMDNCSRYCQAPATMGLFRTVGYGGDSGSIHDIEKAGLVLIVGSNTAESHPVIATRVKRAHICPLPQLDNFTIHSDVLSSLPQQLQPSQAAFRKTGGLHAASLFTANGRLHSVREDVGRHNALDKLLGEAFLRDAVPLRSYLLLLSGRASFELLQKAVMGGIPMVAAIGAPSSLAIEVAREFSITLVGFLRPDSFNIYSAPDLCQGPVERPIAVRRYAMKLRIKGNSLRLRVTRCGERGYFRKPESSRRLLKDRWIERTS